MKKCKHLSETYTKECMNCTRVKQCYHGKMDNYVVNDSSKKKRRDKTKKKKGLDIRNLIKRIGNNVDKFTHRLHYEGDIFEFDNMWLKFPNWRARFYKKPYGYIEDKESSHSYSGSVSIELNSDEEKFLNEKFQPFIMKKEEEIIIKQNERKNRILNSINFGD